MSQVLNNCLLSVNNNFAAELSAPPSSGGLSGHKTMFLDGVIDRKTQQDQYHKSQ